MMIAFFEIKEWEKEQIKRELKGKKILFFEEALNESHLKKIKDIDILSVFIYSKIDKNIIARLPKLKMISTRSTGYDHIDLKECQKRKILVSNIPYYGENTVAEHTFALILSISRNIHKSYMRITKNDFSIEGLKGFDLQGKTLGVIGAGHIGIHVIRIARGFGMKVLVCDHHPDNFLSDVLSFKYVSIDEVLRNSDIITLHVPYCKETHHLINKEAFSKMKKGAILINTSRGAVVDTCAMIDALKNNMLKGVGLDVLEGEELIKEEKQLLHNHKLGAEKFRRLAEDHMLLSDERVVFTPHIAFYSQEALERILNTEIGNIKSYIEGRPINFVKIK